MTAVEYLRDLVRLPSINPMGRKVTGAPYFENRVTDYLETVFRRLGVPFERQLVAPQRENIVARWNAPGATETILFEVHQDTVPVEAMIIDPFGAEVRDGKLYGRGACDVKGSMAAMLATLERLVHEKPSHALNLILACTVDEEHTFLGVQHLIQKGVQANYAIVAEPTNLQIVDAHKGVVRWKVRTPGKACHSSRPDRGENAIYRMGRLLTGIEAYANLLQTSTPDDRLGPPTISVGRIEGGVSVNTVPDDCVIEIDRRLLPGERPEDAPRHFEQFLRIHPAIDFPFICEPVWLACPALQSTGAGPIRNRLGAVLDRVRGSHQVIAVPFGTDASTISDAGIPTVVFGPGDIAQAHTSDEWIDINELEASVEILYQVIAGS